MSGICELCGRAVNALTKHHLIPKARHANKRNQREFHRTEVRQRLAWLCRPCHHHVHALFTEKSLERDFNTVPLLSGHPEVSKFVNWIRHKPDGFKPTSHTSNHKREKLKSNAHRW